ncbi:MAG: DSD1 family PLP-dependent enzyme [Aliiglaciecola sp.]
MLIKDLDTPCLVLNKKQVQKNIDAMQCRMDALGITMRPHGKTAKSIDVINLFEPKHRQKITVSTLKEAEYYFDNGVKDLMYAVGIAPCKLPRLLALIRKGAKISVVLDSLQQVAFLSQCGNDNNVEIPALIEIDCDDHRAGIVPEDPKLIEIGRALNEWPGVCLKGVMTHAGGSYDCQSIEQIKNLAELEKQAALKCVERLNQSQLTCDVVSIGSTPTAMFCEELNGITEIRAGVFMFQDLVMHGLGICETDEIALSVLTSVIGRHELKNWLLVDAGWMALSRDRGTQNQSIDYKYGQVCDLAGVPIRHLLVESTNQEHGILAFSSPSIEPLKDTTIGTILRILPNHACATAAMHNQYYVTQDNKTISEVWQRVNGW